MPPVQKLLTLKAPNIRMAGGTIWCQVEKRILRLDEHALLHDLTDAQAAELLQCGYTLAEGQALLEMRQKANAYAATAVAFSVAEEAVVAAIQKARADGATEAELSEILKSAGRTAETVLPDISEIAPLPSKAAAPAAPPEKMLRPLAPGEAFNPQPGTISDPVAYEAAKAAGIIREIQAAPEAEKKGSKKPAAAPVAPSVKE